MGKNLSPSLTFLRLTSILGRNASYHMLMDNPNKLGNSESYQNTLQQKAKKYCHFFTFSIHL